MSLSLNYPTISPSLLLDFANSGRLDPQVTFTRSSTATFFDASGTLRTANNDAPRFDYDPSTLAAQGLLIEEARTNSIRNNTMQGAVAGVVGVGSAAPPTNWTSFVGANLTFEIIGTGTESGITYIDLRIYGTANATTVVPTFEGDTQVVASNGQTWTSSLYFKIISQPAPFNSYTNRIRINNSGGSQIAQIDTGFSPTTTLTRYVNTGTIASATAAFVNQSVRLGLTSGQAYDVTFRVGLPQLELGAFATSVIPTTTTALTRAADVASVNTLSPWYNQTEGSVYVELQSLSPLTAAQSVALGKFPTAYLFEAGASDSNLLWYGVGVEMFLSNTYNNIGTVPSGVNKFAVSMAPTAGQSRSSLNGAAAENRSGTLSGTATGLFLGGNSLTPGVTALNGWLRRFTYYPRALSAAELPVITA